MENKYWEVCYELFDDNKSVGKFDAFIAAKTKQESYTKAGEFIDAPHSIIYSVEIHHTVYKNGLFYKFLNRKFEERMNELGITENNKAYKVAKNEYERGAIAAKQFLDTFTDWE